MHALFAWRLKGFVFKNGVILKGSFYLQYYLRNFLESRECLSLSPRAACGSHPPQTAAAGMQETATPAHVCRVNSGVSEYFLHSVKGTKS